MARGSPSEGSLAPGTRRAALLFGVALRSARRTRGWSQEALAERAGLHPTFVSLLERGLRQPSLETVLRLSRALGVPVGELVGPVEAAWEPEP